MRSRLGLIPGLIAAFTLPACGGEDGPGTSPGTDNPGVTQTVDGYCEDKTPALIAAAGDPEVAAAPLTEEPIEGSVCNAVVRTYPLESASHVGVCSPVAYTTNPPASGPHYGIFPKFGVYEYAIPRGFYVHSLEHGGVVVTYSCEGCESEVAQAETLVKTLAIEPACCSGGSCDGATNRMLLTPDPGIPTAWAASAWGAYPINAGFVLTADCFEPDVFKSFAESHRGLGPEQICSNTYATDVSQSPSMLAP